MLRSKNLFIFYTSFYVTVAFFCFVIELVVSSNFDGKVATIFALSVLFLVITLIFFISPSNRVISIKNIRLGIYTAIQGQSDGNHPGGLLIVCSRGEKFDPKKVFTLHLKEDDELHADVGALLHGNSVNFSFFVAQHRGTKQFGTYPLHFFNNHENVMKYNIR